ncbi:cytochrome c peroxidase [Ferrovibrio sp.]|uniref:cytochrome-c peroxidase n=1 Tax=Ferrovibrio sp. TaxID=1917215 RepID=UPI00261C0C2E|nr:cytochrome c peroxidase [Ferrovibrio sp.]
MMLFRVWLALLLTVTACRAQAVEPPVFDATQLRLIRSFGPWPPAFHPDTGNPLSGRPSAVLLGAALFGEPRLSKDGGIACQSCHQPQQGWSDGQARSRGLERLDRNAPGLLDSRLQRWFGWDGASDSLWAAAIRPILDPREMGGSVVATATLLRGDPVLACLAGHAADGAQLAQNDEELLVLAARALAAFQETLVSPRTAFDDFRDAVLAGDRDAMARYPASAQRGLALFTGRGQCATCHSGPAFSNGEFHDTGLPFFITDADGVRRVDPGRHRGIARLKENPFNRLGRYNADPGSAAVIPVRHVVQQHRNWGEFKVPTLRSLLFTAPYMHDGSKPDLESVVRHYSELDEDRLHSDGEAILRPLRLDRQEIDDLLAFLGSLSASLDAPAADYAARRADARRLCP